MKVVLLLMLTIGLVSSLPFPEDAKETTTVAPPSETTTTEKLPSDKKPSENAPAENKPEEKEKKLEQPAPNESDPAVDDSKVSKSDDLSHTPDMMTKLAEKTASLKAAETIGEALEHDITKRGIAGDVGEEGEEEEEGEDDKSKSLKDLNRMRRGIAEDSLQIDEVNTKAKTDDKTKNEKPEGKHRRGNSIQITGDSITIFEEGDDDKDENKTATILSTVSTRTTRDTHEDKGTSTQSAQGRMSRFKAARAILTDTKKMTLAEDTHLAALVPEGSGKGSEEPIVAPKKLSGDALKTLLKERIAMRGSNRRSAPAEQSMPENTPVPKKPTEDELKMRAGGALIVKQIRSRRNSNYEASSSDEPTAVETPSVRSSDKKYFATRNRVPENIRIAVQREFPISVESPKTLVKELPIVREVSDDSYGNQQESLPESAPVRTIMEESSPKRTLVRDFGYGTSEATLTETVPILSDTRRVEAPADDSFNVEVVQTPLSVREEADILLTREGYGRSSDQPAATRMIQEMAREEPIGYSAPTRTIVREEPIGYSTPTRAIVREEPIGYSTPTRTIVREEPIGYSTPTRTIVREEPIGYSTPTRTIVREEPTAYSAPTRTLVREEPESRYKRSSGGYGSSEPTRTIVSEEPASYSETTRTVVSEEPASYSEPTRTVVSEEPASYSETTRTVVAEEPAIVRDESETRYRRNAVGYGDSAPIRAMDESSGYSSASSDEQQSSGYSAPEQTGVRDDSSSYSAPQAPSRYRRNAVGYGDSSPVRAMDESSGYSSASSDQEQSSSYSAAAQTEVRDDSSSYSAPQAPSRYRRATNGMMKMSRNVQVLQGMSKVARA